MFIFAEAHRIFRKNYLLNDYYIVFYKFIKIYRIQIL